MPLTPKSGTLSEFIKLFPNMVAFHPEYIQLGKNVSFNHYCHLTANKGYPIKIGNNVLVGPFCVMNTGSHNYEDGEKLIRDQGHNYKAITIGNDVWIAARVTILAGVTIPDGCVIGAGSVVTPGKKLVPYGVYMGYPLQKINQRKKNAT